MNNTEGQTVSEVVQIADTRYQNVINGTVEEIGNIVDKTTPAYEFRTTYVVHAANVPKDLCIYAITKGAAFKRYFLSKIRESPALNFAREFEIVIGELRVIYGHSGLGSGSLTIKRLTILCGFLNLDKEYGLEPSMWKNLDPAIKADLPLLKPIFVPGLAFLYKAIKDGRGADATKDFFSPYITYLPSIVCGCAIMDWLAAIGNKDATPVVRTLNFKQYVGAPDSHVRGELSALLNNNKVTTLDQLGLGDTGILFVKNIFNKRYYAQASRSSAKSASQIMQAILEHKAPGATAGNK